MMAKIMMQFHLKDQNPLSLREVLNFLFLSLCDNAISTKRAIDVCDLEIEMLHRPIDET